MFYAALFIHSPLRSSLLVMTPNQPNDYFCFLNPPVGHNDPSPGLRPLQPDREARLAVVGLVQREVLAPAVEDVAAVGTRIQLFGGGGGGGGGITLFFQGAKAASFLHYFHRSASCYF